MIVVAQFFDNVIHRMKDSVEIRQPFVKLLGSAPRLPGTETKFDPPTVDRFFAQPGDFVRRLGMASSKVARLDSADRCLDMLDRADAMESIWSWSTPGIKSDESYSHFSPEFEGAVDGSGFFLDDERDRKGRGQILDIFQRVPCGMTPRGKSEKQVEISRCLTCQAKQVAIEITMAAARLWSKSITRCLIAPLLLAAKCFCGTPRATSWHPPVRPWGEILSESPRSRTGLPSKGSSPALE
jgi:hypothetical protein